jgi:hypothetical protein
MQVCRVCHFIPSICSYILPQTVLRLRGTLFLLPLHCIIELTQVADRPQPSWAQPEGARDRQGGGREGAGQGREGQVKEEGQEGPVIVHAAAGVLQKHALRTGTNRTAALHPMSVIHSFRASANLMTPAAIASSVYNFTSPAPSGMRPGLIFRSSPTRPPLIVSRW